MPNFQVVAAIVIFIAAILFIESAEAQDTRQYQLQWDEPTTMENGISIPAEWVISYELIETDLSGRQGQALGSTEALEWFVTRPDEPQVFCFTVRAVVGVPPLGPSAWASYACHIDVPLGVPTNLRVGIQ